MLFASSTVSSAYSVAGPKRVQGQLSVKEAFTGQRNKARPRPAVQDDSDEESELYDRKQTDDHDPQFVLVEAPETPPEQQRQSTLLESLESARKRPFPIMVSLEA
jgi:hypothetical protein